MTISLDVKVPMLHEFHSYLYQPDWKYMESKEKDRQVLEDFPTVRHPQEHRVPGAEPVHFMGLLSCDPSSRGRLAWCPAYGRNNVCSSPAGSARDLQESGGLQRRAYDKKHRCCS